jgi:hypothetical protein
LIIDRLQRSTKKTRERWIERTAKHVEFLIKWKALVDEKYDSTYDKKERQRLSLESEILDKKIRRVMENFRRIYRFWECQIFIPVFAKSEENEEKWVN